MSSFFKTDIFSYGAIVACMAVFGAIVTFIVYILLLRSLGAVLITRLNIYRRRRHLVVRAINSTIALLCIGLYLYLMLSIIRVQLTNLIPKQNKVEVVSVKSSKPDCVPSTNKSDRFEKTQLFNDLTSTDLKTRCSALVKACKYVYGVDFELLELDKNILTLVKQMTRSDDILERYLAEQAWSSRCQ